MEDAVRLAHDDLEDMTQQNLSAFWTAVPEFLRRGDFWHAEKNERVGHQLTAIVNHTLEDAKLFECRYLAQTTLGLAKIVKNIESRGKRPLKDNSPHRILRDVFIGRDSSRKDFIFNELATASTGSHVLRKFEPRHLSNLIYAHGLAGHVFEFEDGNTLFDVLALEVVPRLEEFSSRDLSGVLWAYAKARASNRRLFDEAAETILSPGALKTFNSQDLSNVVWAYATAEEARPDLFGGVADRVVALRDLGEFHPQALSNIVWAFATANESHPELFKKVGDRIAALDNLGTYSPQALSNIVWAYATADISHPKLFEKVADHVIAPDNLGKYKPMELSNLLWAYSTAGESQPVLFEKVADHIVTLGKGKLMTCASWHLSNMVWAYATANESHPRLFEKLAGHAIKKQHYFASQHIVNFLWAYATNGQMDQELFRSLVPRVRGIFRECDALGLANIAWAYSVANVAAPTLFHDGFLWACMEKEDEFTLDGLSQLYRWHLWQAEELKSGVRLPPSLKKKCRDAFVSSVPRPLALRGDVIHELSSIGLRPEEGVLTKRGHRLDALVEIGVHKDKIGIEIDGPSCFVGRSPRGSTILKRRQITNIEGIRVVSVPHWEWKVLGNDRGGKQQYLRALLGLIDLEREDELIPH